MARAMRDKHSKEALAFKKAFRECTHADDKSKQKDLQIAEKIGITASQLINFRTGATLPDIENLVKICKCYNVSADYLLGLSKERQLDPDSNKASKYTGLSYKSVEALHYLAKSDPPGTISNAPSINRKNVDFIDRVLGVVYETVVKSDPDRLEAFFSPFYFMECFVRSDAAAREMSQEEENLYRIEESSKDEYDRNNDRIEFAKRHITISEDDTAYTVTVGELYREHVMSNIRAALDSLRENEDRRNQKKEGE